MLISVATGFLVFAAGALGWRGVLGKGHWAEACASAFMTGLLAGLCVYFLQKSHAGPGF